MVGHGSRSCFTIKLLSAFKTFSSKKCTRVLLFIFTAQVNLFGHLVVAGNPVSVFSLKKTVDSKISNKEGSFWRLIHETEKTHKDTTSSIVVKTTMVLMKEIKMTGAERTQGTNTARKGGNDLPGFGMEKRR